MNKAQRTYYQALLALMDKNYSEASAFFKTAENQFADSYDFRILQETTELLLAVKDKIFELENEKVET
jgi:hypothetical protein